MEFNLDKHSGLINFLLTVILGSALVYTQVNIFPWVSILIPLPFIILWVSEGVKYGILSYLALGLILFFLFGPELALPTMLVLIVLSATIAICIDKGVESFRIIFIGGFAYLVAQFLIIFLTQALSGVNIFDELRRGIVEVSQSFYNDIGPSINLNINDSELLLEIQDIANRVVQNIPGLIYALGAVETLINLFLASAVLNRTGSLKRTRYVSEVYMPRALAGFAAISLLLLLILGDTDMNLGILLSNLTLIAGSLVFINGLSTFAFMIKWRRLGCFPFFIFVIFFSIRFLIIIFLMLGSLDVLLNIRKNMKARGGRHG